VILAIYGDKQVSSATTACVAKKIAKKQIKREEKRLVAITHLLVSFIKANIIHLTQFCFMDFSGAGASI